MNSMLRRAGVAGPDNLNQEQVEALHCVRFRESYSRDEIARKVGAARATLSFAITTAQCANDP
jgi:hypothetical protein